MNKNAEMDRLWGKICQLERALQAEAKANKGTPSKHYMNLKRDMEKLKVEYEKVKGGGAYNPLSLDHGETATRKTVVDKFLGRQGKDSHARLEDR